MRLSIIIVCHGHEAMLRDCLASLRSALRDDDTEILLIDNLSDGTAEQVLIGAFPEVLFVKNRSPKGLSANMNDAAQRTRGKYLLFLNPDTMYASGDLYRAIEYLETHPDIALLSCRLLNADGSLQQNYRRFPTLPIIIGRAFGADHWPWQPRFYRARMMQGVALELPTLVDWVFGAFMLIRRDCFASVGGMDPEFRLYYEDVDLCYRLRARGLSTVYYPELRFVHRHMRASARRPLGRAWRAHVRSACRILRKHRYLLSPPIEGPHM
jgi:hypothetical protein